MADKNAAQGQAAAVVLHIDMDAFYCAVERRVNPELKGVPIVVIMYNPFGAGTSRSATEPRYNLEDANGTIIAVSYEARAKGVKRLAGMRGPDARKLCPDLVTVQVPTNHLKADLSIYRDAGAEVVSVLKQRYPHTSIVQRASIDEVYIDVTAEVMKQLAAMSNEEDFFANMGAANISYIAGSDKKELALNKDQIRGGHQHQGTVVLSEVDPWFRRPWSSWSEADRMLCVGAKIAAEFRRDIFEQLGFECTSGIATNMLLAKIASAFNKPNRQTIVPTTEVAAIMDTMPLGRIPGLGGKLGEKIEALLEEMKQESCTMGALLRFGRDFLVSRFGEDAASKIINLGQGIDHDKVADRPLPKSISNGKSFRSHKVLRKEDFKEAGKAWKVIEELCSELLERTEKDEQLNDRRPTLFVASMSIKASSDGPVCQTSRSCKWVNTISPSSLTQTAVSLWLKAVEDKPEFKDRSWYATYLTVEATKFEDTSCSNPITKYFSSPAKKDKEELDQERERKQERERERERERGAKVVPVRKLPIAASVPRPAASSSSSSSSSLLVVDDDDDDDDDGGGKAEESTQQRETGHTCPVCSVLFFGTVAAATAHVDFCLAAAESSSAAAAAAAAGAAGGGGAGRGKKRKDASSDKGKGKDKDKDKGKGGGGKQAKLSAASPSGKAVKPPPPLVGAMSSAQKRIQDQIEHDKQMQKAIALSALTSTRK